MMTSSDGLSTVETILFRGGPRWWERFRFIVLDNVVRFDVWIVGHNLRL
jgi:hypothetical protein